MENYKLDIKPHQNSLIAAAPQDLEVIREIYKNHKGVTFSIELKIMKPRTLTQNGSFWLWLEKCSQKFNYLNIPAPNFLDLDIMWTKEKFKMETFDHISLSTYNKTSSKLSTKEFSNCVELTFAAVAKKGVELPEYPSKEFLTKEDGKDV